MDSNTIILIAVLMALAAALYTSVGHAGASGYLAIMALFAVPAATMKPTALVLNIIVASITTFRFVRAGQFNGRLLIPFVVGAIPAAFIAGHLTLPGHYYRPLVGVILWCAALRLLWPRAFSNQVESPDDSENAANQESRAVHRSARIGNRSSGGETVRQIQPPLWPVSGAIGGGIGFLSGLTGTGGGIFLSPIILFSGWEAVRKTSGTAAGFILCVSLAGLAGNISSIGHLPTALPWFIGAVLIGTFVGTRLGLSILPAARLLQALGLVLIVAGAKLIFT